MLDHSQLSMHPTTMSEDQPEPKEETTTSVQPQSGEEVAGMKVVDPIADAEKDRSEEVTASTKKTTKKGPAKGRAAKDPAEELCDKVEKLLNDNDLQVEVIGEDEHPRGPVVAVKRLPDTTRPIVYIDSGDRSWEPRTLTLNMYGFLDSRSMNGLSADLKEGLGLSDSQVVSFTRF